MGDMQIAKHGIIKVLYIEKRNMKVACKMPPARHGAVLTSARHSAQTPAPQQ